MHYRGSWRNTKGFGIGLWCSVVLFSFAPWVFGDWRTSFLSVFLVAYVLGISLLSVDMDEQRLVIGSWLRRAEFAWSEIISVTQAADFPWPRNRFYGPNVYQIRAHNQIARLNLMYFSVDFRRSFLQRVQQEKLLGK